ncbi:hypothetical protein OSB04_017560 [Centaurea solstitialis]|uniref:Ankyrin repeat protein n=1 Tax=Centaurea solstitialis TaxID=347529 RepID=A0AA38T336_9ASTR|nr:hypothetical protein OSB04_017560 [Centaurea solstitialis]
MELERDRDKVREKKRDMEPERDMELEWAALYRSNRRDEQYFNICVPLYEACLTANWDAANAIFVQNRDYVRYAIDMTYNTPLHIVAYAQETKQTNDFELQLKNNISNNAFCLAASSGNIEMVTNMVRMNNELVNIPGYDEKPPLFKRALYGKYGTLKYLFVLSALFCCLASQETCVHFDFFDVALKIVRNHPQLAKEGSILGVLARKPNAFKRDCTRCCDKDDENAWRLLKIIWRDNIMRMTTDEVQRILRASEVL